MKHAIYVEDAQKGKYEIEQIRKLALEDSLYHDENQMEGNRKGGSSVFEFEQMQRNGNYDSSNNNSSKDISDSTIVNTKINGGIKQIWMFYTLRPSNHPRMILLLKSFLKSSDRSCQQMHELNF